MVLDRATHTIEHRVFADLPEILQPGDLLVRNDAKVAPSRLLGVRTATGGAWEGLFLRELTNGKWEVLAKTRGKPNPGERVRVGDGLELLLEAKGEAGVWIVRPDGLFAEVPTFELLEKHGKSPLPPYIRGGVEGASDRTSYQTIYARNPGTAAAPTAGLHFTSDVFDHLRARQIGWVDVTLYVGLGTFRPIEVEEIEEHVMHSEWAEVSRPAVERINQVRENGKRVVAVGTTSARLLETAATRDGVVEPFRGETSIYLRPGTEFRAVDALITNFHLPRSSLMVLVSAFAGVEFVKSAYKEAVERRYRFYSYGDAMIIL